MAINIVLVEPEIPQNTGNIVRTCAALGANLHLIRPLGFSVEDKFLKRAGLDYWDKVKITYYDSFNELKGKFPNGQFFFVSTKALKSYTNVSYCVDCFLVFGKETAGLPEELLNKNLEHCVRIPMKSTIRSLNLANSVAIVAYEAARQNEFIELVQQGSLS